MKKQKGFKLIEIMICVALAGALSAVALGAWNNKENIAAEKTFMCLNNISYEVTTIKHGQLKLKPAIDPKTHLIQSC